MTYQPTGQAVNPDDSSVDPRLAAAVPEAQDGRRVSLYERGMVDALRTVHIPHRLGIIKAAMAVADSELAASAAVREGERERLAAAIEARNGPPREQRNERARGFDEGWNARGTFEAAQIRAAPSLAAPEGTEQP